MDEFPARALAGKLEPCAARKNTRTVRGKSVVCRAWESACLISFIGRGKRGMVAHRRFSGKRSLYFHCIIWHNLSGLKFTHNSPSAAAKKEKKNYQGITCPPGRVPLIPRQGPRPWTPLSKVGGASAKEEHFQRRGENFVSRAVVL